MAEVGVDRVGDGGRRCRPGCARACARFSRRSSSVGYGWRRYASRCSSKTRCASFSATSMRRSCAVWAMNNLRATGGRDNLLPGRGRQPGAGVGSAQAPATRSRGIMSTTPGIRAARRMASTAAARSSTSAVDRDLATLDGDAQLADVRERGGEDVDHVVRRWRGRPGAAPPLSSARTFRVSSSGGSSGSSLAHSPPRSPRPGPSWSTAAGDVRHGGVGVDASRARRPLIARVEVLVAVRALLDGAVVLVRVRRPGIPGRRSRLSPPSSSSERLVLAAVAERR